MVITLPLSVQPMSNLMMYNLMMYMLIEKDMLS